VNYIYVIYKILVGTSYKTQSDSITKANS